MRNRVTRFFLAFIASQAHGAPPEGQVALYVHAQLIDVATGTILPDRTIVVRGSRIESVLASGSPRATGSRVIDLHGQFVAPGLVNSHVHLATQALPEAARAYLRRELYSGVTTVRDMAGDVRLLSELKREAEFDEIAAPDIYYAALMAGPDFFVDPRTHEAARGRTAGEVPWMQAITSTSDLPEAVAQARGTGATGIKLYADLPAQVVSAVTAEAHRQHLLVWSHAAIFPAKPSDVVAAGVDVMSHACLIGYEVSDPPVATVESKRRVDGALVKKPNAAIDAVFAGMRQRGIILDATLWIYEAGEVTSCLPAESDALGRAAHLAGVTMSVGTDDDPDWTHRDSEIDSELESLVERAGLSPAEALRAATIGGARTVGEEGTIGGLDAGKLANFVVWKANPLTDIRNVRRVVLVVKHGRRFPRSDYRPYRPVDAAHT